MNRITLSLIVILLLSVGFNLILWYSGQQTIVSNNITESEQNDNLVTAPEYSGNPVPLKEIITHLDVEPLHRLLQNGEYIELGRRLQDALRILPNNTELLLMEAEYIAKTQPLSDAILNYYDLLDRPLSDKVKVLIQSRIDNLQNQVITRFEQTQQWDLLAQFIEPLFQRIPEDTEYILTLAEAYGQQGNFSLMESVLASLEEDNLQAIALRKKLSSTQNQQVTSSESYTVDESNLSEDNLALVRSGDHFLVDLFVEETPVRLIIDTGASLTALSARTFERLSDDYPSEFLGVFQVNTAGGIIDAPMVSFDRVSLGRYTFRNLTIVVIPSDPFAQAEGLLGMNVLRAFNFRIDQQKPELLLKEF